MMTLRPHVRLVALVGFCVCVLATPALAQDCPELLGQWPDDDPNFVAVDEPYAYVGRESDSTFMVADISDPASPEVVGSLDFPSTVTDVAAAYGYVLVAASDFFVVDVSTPSLPHIEGSLGLLYTENIAVSGQYAYLTYFFPTGLHIVDMSVPSSPAETGLVEILFDGTFTDVVIAGEYAYLPWINQFGSPPSGLKVIDVHDPSAPFEAGSIDFSNDWVGGFAVYRGYAYLGTLDGIRVIDVSTPTAPVEVGFVAMPCLLPGEIAVARGLAWVACWEGGIRVMDLANPLLPVEVGSYVSPEMIRYVGLGSDYAVAAAYQSAFLVFEQCELPVFADGFESGNTTQWSLTVP
jgi:hypothetical protein